MKLTVFIVTLFLILHGREGEAYGYVYTIKEFANGHYTGYLKVGHTSDTVDENIGRRISNLRAGNPRYLEYFRMCRCPTKAIAAQIETLVRHQNPQLAATLGGSREWLHVQTNQLANFIQWRFYAPAQQYNCACPYAWAI